jgi:hypothetical protein
MSTTPSTAKAKKARAAASSSGPATPKRRKGAAMTRTVSGEQRHAMIAERAYLLAEQRGFQGGDPVQDWLEGEKAVDALLSRSAD